MNARRAAAALVVALLASCSFSIPDVSSNFDGGGGSTGGGGATGGGATGGGATGGGATGGGATGGGATGGGATGGGATGGGSADAGFCANQGAGNWCETFEAFQASTYDTFDAFDGGAGLTIEQGALRARLINGATTGCDSVVLRKVFPGAAARLTLRASVMVSAGQPGAYPLYLHAGVNSDLCQVYVFLESGSPVRVLQVKEPGSVTADTILTDAGVMASGRFVPFEIDFVPGTSLTLRVDGVQRAIPAVACAPPTGSEFKVGLNCLDPDGVTRDVSIDDVWFRIN